MEYRRFKDKIIVRIDRGEEILSKIKEVAEKEEVTLAEINALGAVDDFIVGCYDMREKKYHPNEFKGFFEIVSLTGTITTKDGEYYSHIHMSAADKDGNVVGGHLNKAIVGVTCEAVITVIDGVVDRKYDEIIGINLFKFRL